MVTVNKASLTVTVIDTSRHVGEANPKVRIVYSGFVGTDSIKDLERAPLVSIGATVNSPAGIYDITLGLGLDENYDFNYVNGKLTVTNPDGISLKNDLGLKIYPNPSSGILYISSSKALTDVEVNIQDIQGKPVLIKRIPVLNSPVQFNLAEIPKGLYFIRLTIGTDTFVQKLVLK